MSHKKRQATTNKTRALILQIVRFDDIIIYTMGQIKRPFYNHYLFEVKCNFDEANSINWLETKIVAILEILGITKLKTVYHQFQPQGISLVHILSASHIAIHTWPENGYIQADFISCQRDIDLQKITSAADKVFQGYEHKVTELNY